MTPLKEKRSISDIRVGDWVDHEREVQRHRVRSLRWSPGGPKSLAYTVCGMRLYTVSALVDNRVRSDKKKCSTCGRTVRRS